MWCSTLKIPILFAIVIAGRATSEYLEEFEETVKDSIAYQKYMEIEKLLKMVTNSGVKIILPYIMEANVLVNISSSCRSDILFLISEVRKLKIAAFNFLDATGKPSDGILTGNINMVGDYDQCLRTFIFRKYGNLAFKGKYCLLRLRPPVLKRHYFLESEKEKNYQDIRNASEVVRYLMSVSKMLYYVTPKFGLCAPSGCSKDDIEQGIEYVSDRIYMNVSLLYCDESENVRFPPGRIVAVCVFSFFGILCVVGTLLDHHGKNPNIQSEGFISRFILCFSIKTNFARVTNTKISDQLISCLNGVRVLSLFYIILEHHYFMGTMTYFEDHLLRKFQKISDFLTQIILNGFLTTDVFFFIGGLTNCYSRMKAKETDKSNISVFHVIVHRLWRLYPAYAMSILISYLFDAGYGPMNTLLAERHIENCNKNWWKNILFINNFFDQEDMCMTHSWYIAADMQLFLLSLLIHAVLFRNALTGILLNIGLIITGLCATLTLAWYKGIMPGIILHNWNLKDVNHVMNTFMTPFPHMAPYFIGMLTGYLLHEKKDFKISKVALYIGWTSASLMFLSMLFVTKRWNSGGKYAIAESAFYFTFSRPIYVLAVAWMVFCCARGYGGFINHLLSFKIWIPLARISYMAYLISPIIQMFYAANMRRVPDNQRMITIWKYVADLTISCLTSFALVIFLESPFTAMEKLFTQRKLLN